MRYYTTIILLLTFTVSGYAQTYEIGGFLGSAKYIGDVGKTTYISASNVAFGGIFKWNRSPRHSFRGTLIVANISGDDLDSNEERRKQRGYSFENTLTEISAGLEFTFWEFRLHSGYPQTTPYLYTGLTYFRYDNLFKRRDDVFISDQRVGSVAIPMVVGLKTSIGGTFVLGFEIGARYTFTDNLDGSNPVGDLADNSNLKFGNINSDDWYVFTGVTLTVMFGRKPCYCNF